MNKFHRSSWKIALCLFLIVLMLSAMTVIAYAYEPATVVGTDNVVNNKYLQMISNGVYLQFFGITAVLYDVFF